MRNVVLLLSSCLLLTNCGKTIIYGKPLASTVSQGDYGEEIIVQQKSNNNSAKYGSVFYKGQNSQEFEDQDEVIINQAKNVNSGNNSQQSYSDYEILDNTINNDSSNTNINLSKKNSFNNDDLLSKAINGNNAKNSALLVEDVEKGQVELSSRDAFNSQKSKQQVKTNYNNNETNNYIFVEPKEQKKVKYSIEPQQQKKTNVVTTKQQAKQQISNAQVLTKKSYKIQCGNYVNEKAAQQIANKIRNAGIKNVSVISDGQSHRILVGDFNSKDEGFAIFEKIESLNLRDNIFWTFR